MRLISAVTLTVFMLTTFIHASQEEKPVDTPRTDLSIAFGLPYVIASDITESRAMVVEAVYQATALSGGYAIVNTGTLAPGLNGYTYSPKPKDKLVVIWEGRTHEFVVKNAQGNMQATTSDAWLSSPHLLNYTHHLKDMAKVEISTRFDGVRFNAQVKGWYLQSGIKYQVDLSAAGRSTGESDFHGQDIRTTYTLTGKIKGPSMELDVRETHQWALASATNLRLLHSQRGSASRLNATLNNVLRSHGKEYRLKNVQAQFDRKVKGGSVIHAGFTQVSGTVLKDGKTFGQCILKAGRVCLRTRIGYHSTRAPRAEARGKGRRAEESQRSIIEIHPNVA